MIYIALLRGINVSGQKKIKMADLRTYLGDAGLQDVQTYIQSGNIVFKSENADKAELAQKISDEIKEAYGFDVPVLVLTADYLQSAIEQNTYFADVAKLCEPDPIDGLHLDVKNTRQLGVGIAKALALEGFANFS